MNNKTKKCTCNHCNTSYTTIGDIPDSCPACYQGGKKFSHPEYTIDEHIELSKLRHQYIGKTKDVSVGLLIVLDVLDLNHLEFILMPNHRIIVSTIDCFNTLN